MMNSKENELFNKNLRLLIKAMKLINQLNDENNRLQKENDNLRAIINAPDIDFPNSEKGGKATQDRPDNCPDFSDF